jgi:hypothetical protein
MLGCAFALAPLKMLMHTVRAEHQNLQPTALLAIESFLVMVWSCCACMLRILLTNFKN